MSSSDKFPLITLQPVADAGHCWVALMLEGDVPLDNAVLTRVLGNYALAESLDDALSCIAAVDPALIDPVLVGPLLPPGRLILRFPVAIAADPAQHATLAVLQDAGLGLMATGFPEPGAALFPGLASLAVTCSGRAAPTGLADWLRKLPGPHLALGPTTNICPGLCKFHWRAGHEDRQVAITKGDPTSRSLLLNLLVLVTSDADSTELGDPIKRDPNLAYHLLKLVNSPAFAPDSRITSFAQAVVLQALTTGDGRFGAFLTAVVASEGPPSPKLADALVSIGISREDWAAALAEAARWAVLVSQEA